MQVGARGVAERVEDENEKSQTIIHKNYRRTSLSAITEREEK
jgi:hypothetical protein